MYIVALWECKQEFYREQRLETKYSQPVQYRTHIRSHMFYRYSGMNIDEAAHFENASKNKLFCIWENQIGWDSWTRRGWNAHKPYFNVICVFLLFLHSFSSHFSCNIRWMKLQIIPHCLGWCESYSILNSISLSKWFLNVRQMEVMSYGMIVDF